MALSVLCLVLAVGVFLLVPLGSAWGLLALIPCAVGYAAVTGDLERRLRRRGWHT